MGNSMEATSGIGSRVNRRALLRFSTAASVLTGAVGLSVFSSGRAQAAVYAPAMTPAVVEPVSAELANTLSDTVNSRVGVEYRITDLNKFVLGPTVPTTWTTPDGSGVSVHPSVRFFPNGFNGYRWWAASTPYFQSNNQLENPCIYVSQDGTNWAPPPGVTNPLCPAPPAGYNSDTHLIQAPNGKLYLFYRDYSSNGTAAEKIVLMESADGIAWTAPKQIIGWADNVKRLMSPAVWWDGSANKWVMLGVEILAQPRVIQRFTAPNAYGPWTYDQNVTFDLPWPATRSPWHIDAMQIGTQVLLVVQDAIPNSGGGDVYLALSEDEGKSFKRGISPIATGLRYRSCVLPKLTEEGLALDLWLGTVGGNWTINRGTATVSGGNSTNTVNTIQGLTPSQELTLAMTAAKSNTMPYVLGDDFNRADNVTALGSAPSGQIWTKSLGTLAVVGKKAVVLTAANSRAFIDCGVSDYEISANVYTPGVTGHQPWIVFRAIDGSNYLRFGFDGRGLSLQRVTSGAVTVVSDFGIQPGSLNIRLSAQCNNDQIICTAGNQTFTATVSQGRTSTLVGLQLNNTDMSIDNLLVKSL